MWNNLIYYEYNTTIAAVCESSACIDGVVIATCAEPEQTNITNIEHCKSLPIHCWDIDIVHYSCFQFHTTQNWDIKI